NVSHRHDLHLGYNQSGTTNPSLGEADAVLVVEADVPWYPHLKKPAPGAPIIHLGVDPFFSRYPMRSYPCDVPIVATPGAALPLPGSYFGSRPSSGLGFGLGAALGVKLARPDATVIATAGDGAYFFGEPLSCLFVQRAHALPILTVIFNNQQWEAVKFGAL